MKINIYLETKDKGYALVDTREAPDGNSTGFSASRLWPCHDITSVVVWQKQINIYLSHGEKA